MNVSRDVQETVVAALLKSSYLFSICRSEITDGYFSDPSCKVIYKALSSYYRKYQAMPDLNALLISIDECYYPTVGVNLSEVKDACQRLYEYPEPNEMFIKDKITDFVRKVRSSSALKNFVDQMKVNPNLESDSVVSELVKALEVQLSTTKVFMMDNLDSVKEARQASVGSEDQSRIVKSTINSLNQSLMFGGYQPSTVNMIVAPPGCFTGRTMVHTSEGPRSLEELYLNQENLNIFGRYENEIREGKYKEVYLSDYVDELLVVVVNGQYEIECTPDHPFILENGVVCQAKYLEVGQELATYNSSQRMYVTYVVRKKLEEKVPVYGIVDVEPFGNFALALSEKDGVFVSNTGKSMFLVNEGVYAAKQGFDVLHVFIGDMVEYDGFIRYLSCISGTPQNSLVMMPVEKQMEVVKVCNQQYNNVFDRLFILAYPSLSLGVDTLVEDINRFEKQLKKDFGVIIIDYPDNLIQEGRSLYEDGGTLYSSLERLARISQSVLLVASQPQKSYWNHSIIPLEAAAESSKKQQCVDLMLTMNTDSRGANFGTMLLAKARKGNVGKVFRFKTDYARCRIEEIDESTYQAMKSSSALVK